MRGSIFTLLQASVDHEPILIDPTPPQESITQLLQAVQAGDRRALESLFPLVYGELHALALAQRRRWNGDLTLNATALVHEAYIKLVDQTGLAARTRGHFFAVAAKAMRHILCNYARDRQRLKRGGGAQHVSIDDALDAVPTVVWEEQAEQLAALDDALQRLAQVSERQSRIVECRFFGGLSIEETAAALDLSPATVKRDWTMARAWLYRELQNR
jgi:RNA polymerase sigma factor (TIGR02999 family)